jgi:uncharacterized protein (UPF0332 family)
METKIQWCFRQKNCVELIDTNENLAQGYIKKAEDALEEMRNAIKREWRIETAYYAMYHSIYSLLMKIGLKSELHACTIEFIGKLFPEDFPEETIMVLKKSLEIRKDATYYVNREITDDAMIEMMVEAPKIIAKCKAILPKITESKVKAIRKEIEKLKI